MLLIGDIHINTRFQDKILNELRTIFAQYPEEKNIIFLGDYVYHFAYDRNALLQLYKLFLELFEQGKIIYVISGNHDRLGNSFVFEEAQKAFDIMIKAIEREKRNHGKIQFITKPIIENIEGKKILLLPFFLESEKESGGYIPKNERLKAISEFSLMLEKSTNKHEAFSGHLNKILAEQIDRNPDLTIIHHYYINGTPFPGQKSRFTYKDIALNEQFLDFPDIKLVSGHLHQPFTHKNYLCTGSVRSTSSLETNQTKYAFHMNASDDKITALPMMINPQVRIRREGAVDKEELLRELQIINEANKNNFSSPSRDIRIIENTQPNIENISLTLEVDHIDYDRIDDVIDPDLRMACKDIRLKKDTGDMDKILTNFKVSSEELNGFSDRKNILEGYLQRKFGDEYHKYEKTLKELKLL